MQYIVAVVLGVLIFVSGAVSIVLTALTRNRVIADSASLAVQLNDVKHEVKETKTQTDYQTTYLRDTLTELKETNKGIKDCIQKLTNVFERMERDLKEHEKRDEDEARKGRETLDAVHTSLKAIASRLATRRKS